MPVFYLKLAEQVIQVDCMYETTEQLCAGYLLPKESCGIPWHTVLVRQQEINEERRRSKEYGDNYQDAYIETLAVYRQIAEAMIERDTLLIHGSALAMDGNAYLFTAKSGTGKSTHSRLWREQFGQRVVMVNDDKPLIHIGESEVTVYGTPWNGKHHMGSNMAAPLKAICFLHRDRENHIEPCKPDEVFTGIFKQTYRSPDPQKLQKTITLLYRLMNQLPAYALYCNMDPEAAHVSYEGMKMEMKV